MILGIDTAAATLTLDGRTIPLYSAEAFSLLTREWLRLGWNLHHYARTKWMGRTALQLPDDTLRLAELVWTLRPSVIIETGVFEGGTALLFASICRLSGHGRVISIEREPRPGVAEALTRAGITFIEGDSTAPAILERVHASLTPLDTVLVFLDSDHRTGHVMHELELYAPLVSPNSYLIVADTNMADLATLPNGDPAWAHENPHVAVERFLASHPNFRLAPPDDSPVTYFNSGWLLRTSI